ncbi:hypothetical protein BH10CHL1_BH10CHL1_37680 [soil metagenome]
MFTLRVSLDNATDLSRLAIITELLVKGENAEIPEELFAVSLVWLLERTRDYLLNAQAAGRIEPGDEALQHWVFFPGNLRQLADHIEAIVTVGSTDDDAETCAI